MAPDPQVRERVDEQLRGLLRSGELLPGATVPIVHLARRWATSETPIREVGWRAVGEGWLTPEPRGGFRVWWPSVEELRDLYQALELLLIGAIGFLPLERSSGDQWSTKMRPIGSDATSSFLALSILSGNGVLQELTARMLDRLGPFQRAEATLLRDTSDEDRRLAELLAGGTRAALRETVRRYCVRRHSLAPATLGLIGEWLRSGGR